MKSSKKEPAREILELAPKITNWMRNELKPLTGEIVTSSRFNVLNYLKSSESLSNWELAELLSITPATLTRTIDALCRDGLVKRKRDSSDRRRVTITITVEGEIATDLHQNRLFERLTTKLKPLTRSERACVLRSLAILSDVF